MKSSASASATTAEAGFRLIAESIPHIVWTAAPNGVVEYFNRQATTFAGSRTEAARAWDWLSLVHPDDADRASVAWQHALATETTLAQDLRIRRSDRTYRWHAFRCLVIRDADRAVQK